MEIPAEAVTKDQFIELINEFLEEECMHGVVGGAPLVHIKCYGSIRQGFVNAYVDGSTTPVPIKVPYCESCDPPDGFKNTYSRGVQISSTQ